MAPSQEQAALRLPLSVVGPIDMGRLLRELEQIDNIMMQGELTHKGVEAKLPKTTKLMDDTIALNKLDLGNSGERQRLQAFLVDLRDHSPLLHISFSADPSPVFVEKLMLWLRQEIHPNVLLTVGLQPSIGAGCLVRTTNKYFDFSLRSNFEKNRALLMSKLRETVAP